jgi:S1-C subfamily serine protease
VYHVFFAQALEVSMLRVRLLVVLISFVSHAFAFNLIHAADFRPRVPQNIRPLEGDDSSASRVANTLQTLNKNLILDATRGERDIAVFQKAAPAVVLVLVGKESIGSGAIITKDGKVITNWHVVGSSPRATVVLKPKDSSDLKKELAFSATVEKVDQITDLALLKITAPPSFLTSLDFANTASLNIGQDVHAIGHPNGAVWTYTKGLISQMRPNHEWKTESGINHRANVIQTQTPINPGNSGGPLLDDSARLIGVNSFKSGGEGLNYAISVDAVRDFLTREGSRVAAPSPQAKRELRCPDGYDTAKRGWNDIVGCYHDSVAPPPDLWFVYRAPIKTRLRRNGFGYLWEGNQNDVVRKNLDPDWKITELYIDSDCDGSVDVIEKYAPTGRISSRLPSSQIRLISLARELNSALTSGRIPYRNLRLCQ